MRNLIIGRPTLPDLLGDLPGRLEGAGARCLRGTSRGAARRLWPWPLNQASHDARVGASPPGVDSGHDLQGGRTRSEWSQSTTVGQVRVNRSPFEEDTGRRRQGYPFARLSTMDGLLPTPKHNRAGGVRH
jgi:hypothetical protein